MLKHFYRLVAFVKVEEIQNLCGFLLTLKKPTIRLADMTTSSKKAKTFVDFCEP